MAHSTNSQPPPPYPLGFDRVESATTSVTKPEEHRLDNANSDIISPSHQGGPQINPFLDNAAVAPPNPRAARQGSGLESYNSGSPMPEGPDSPRNYGMRPAQPPSAPPVNWFSVSGERQSFDSRAPASRSNSGHISLGGNNAMITSTSTSSITPLFDQFSTTPGPARTNSPTPISIAPATYSSKPPETKPIYFYDRDKPYYEFTNFSPNPVSQSNINHNEIDISRFHIKERNTLPANISSKP